MTERAAAASGRRLSRAAPFVVAALAALALWIAPLVPRHLRGQRADPLDDLRGAGRHGGPALGLHRHPDLRAGGVLRHRRLRHRDGPGRLGATPLGIAAAVAAALVAPALLGLAVGWLSFYHRSTPLYASVISLVVPIVVVQLIFSGGEWTGSSSGLVGFDVLPFEIEGYFRLRGAVPDRRHRWRPGSWSAADAGRALVAIRDNEARCAYLGLNPRRLQILLTAALAGDRGARGLPVRQRLGRGRARECRLPVRHRACDLGGAGRPRHPARPGPGHHRASTTSRRTCPATCPSSGSSSLGTAFVAIIILLPDGLADLVAGSGGRCRCGRREPAPPRLVARVAGDGGDRDRDPDPQGRGPRQGLRQPARCWKASTWRSGRANSSASSAPTAPARPR